MSASEKGADGLPPSSDNDVGQAILQNEELVRHILESADTLSEPMSRDAFLEWLKSGTGNPPLPS
jgi:hypothetical protein